MPPRSLCKRLGHEDFDPVSIDPAPVPSPGHRASVARTGPYTPCPISVKALRHPCSGFGSRGTRATTFVRRLYLAAILDLFSRRVVGWAASANNDRALALGALDRAIATRTPLLGLIHHSDRGSVYASADYGDALTKLGAVKSMSRKGDCWDNAVAESFFATIKGEMIDHENYPTRSAAIAAIADYIDGFYNPCRRHSALDYVSPIEFELRFMSEKIEKMAA